MTTYFCDGLKEVSVVNGVVRLEFHRLEAVQRGGNRELQPIAEFTIALPLQGYMQALGVLENVRHDISSNLRGLGSKQRNSTLGDALRGS